MKIRNFLKLALSTFAFFVLVQSTLAISISPSRTEIDIDPGETKTLIITVFNEGDEEMDNVVTEVEAFNKNSEEGYPINDETDENNALSVTKWITYSDTGFPLLSKEGKKVTITITAPEDAEPGGKYAQILFSQRPKTDGLNGSTGIVVVSRVASLLLLKVSGDIYTTGEIESIKIAEEIKSDEAIPFSVTFRNNGNVHIKPLGDIKITNTKTGREIIDTGSYMGSADSIPTISNTIIINRNGGNVLPGSNRIFISQWSQNFENGKFTATATMSYGEGIPVTKQVEFEIDESVKIDKFDINILSGSSNFTFTVKNTGNVIERLTGFISITNAFGYEVAKIDLPEDMEFVNPGDTKDYQIEWIKTDMPEGSYKATLHGELGLTKETVKASVRFGEITNLGYVIGGIALLIIAGLLFLLFRKKRKANRNA